MKKMKTDCMIDELVAVLGHDASPRQVHVYRESLRSLVRLAKAEQMHEVRQSAERLGGGIAARMARKQTRELLMAHRGGAVAQRKLEFDPS
jgi:hypothetical protein